MKKITKNIFILFSIILIGISAQSQDVVVLKHTNYTSHFSKSKHYPVMVEWWITRAKVNCPTPLKRKDNFKPDPLLPIETDLAKDYVGSGNDIAKCILITERYMDNFSRSINPEITLVAYLITLAGELKWKK